MFRRAHLALLFLPLALACSEGNGTDDGNGVPDGGVLDPKDGGMETPDGGNSTFAVSEKANLRFKEVLRLTNDFARALELDPNQVCLELGQYDCRLVHNIALGGVEPYELGLVEPTPNTTITTPIAAERLAVHACERRVTADLDNGLGQVFFGLGDGGPIPNIDDPVVGIFIDSLYKRAVLRPAKETEVAHLSQLYRDIEALGVEKPGRQWAIASCVAVLTSVEALFY